MAHRNNKKLQGLIAQKLKILREMKGVSQQQVYNDTDVHIGRLETASRNATVNTIAILCNYFGISLKDFFAEGFDEIDKKNGEK